MKTAVLISKNKYVKKYVHNFTITYIIYNICTRVQIKFANSIGEIVAVV